VESGTPGEGVTVADGEDGEEEEEGGESSEYLETDEPPESLTSPEPEKPLESEREPEPAPEPEAESGAGLPGSTRGGGPPWTSPVATAQSDQWRLPPPRTRVPGAAFDGGRCLT
jgi:hypothetical protein